ncbi:cytochrome bc1 complex Rieske iron-sulfur subunit [Actinocatenispora rupis]|uniref:Cytochrome bc1 complex Rieske iron-sulfur subunit n=1 Tax=Actinocatenispora rupis TaxID=519421 RepID=A0A8J3JEN9_9ACTN|nr:ubiquinol-cytochrome c reductase iron-sulfur subunit [Actinocatenispora rupis]GID13473.1 ubiquinol-cytochrome c reductase iron-sulfur subunit [Actinocatenispora rupis]
MSTPDTEREAPEFDPDDPKLTRFDLVREAARRDGVEIVHYEPRFTQPGSKEEKRVVRFIALCFAIVGLTALAFIVAYVAWPWQYKGGANLNKWYTPVLGATLGLSLLFIGIAIVTWAKKLLPEEVSVQERHEGASPDDERKLTVATTLNVVDELGIKRRPLLKGAIALGLAPVGVAAIMPLGGLIKDHRSDLIHTAWKKGVRLMHDDGTLVRPEDVSAGGQITVFPAIPEGNSNKYADSPTLLIHLREDDAAKTRANALPINKGAQWQNYVAYSKICTHAGCPASLYEQQTNRLLCPCHQSQFDILNNARPIFGPATRRLPQLPITVDGDGYFVATSDYKVPIGPGFWERP